MKYFLKYIVSNVMFVGGKPVPFEVLADDLGVIALDEGAEDPDTQAQLKALNAAAASHVLGVNEIDRARYEELKKNSPSLKFGPLSTPYPPLDAGPVLQVPPRPPVFPQAAADTEEGASLVGQEPRPGQEPSPDEHADALKTLASAGGFIPKTKRVRG